MNSLDEHATQQLAWLLERVLKEEGGTLGFGILEPVSQTISGTDYANLAPGILADADDTAKAILTLSIIGRNTNPQKMITEFDTGVHFRTYRGERNSSFSANCNVLHALLHIENPERYRSQILRAAEYICEAWCAGDVKDKWV